MYICRRHQLNDSSTRLLTDSVSSTSSPDSPDDVIRCSTLASDVTSQLHNPQTDDVTVTSRTDAVPTRHFGTVPPMISFTDGTVPETLDYRSMLVGAALARQEMMTSLNHDSYLSNYPYRHRHSRRFTPYVITNDSIPTSFRPA